jgi:hypothetical protein
MLSLEVNKNAWQEHGEVGEGLYLQRRCRGFGRDARVRLYRARRLDAYSGRSRTKTAERRIAGVARQFARFFD